MKQDPHVKDHLPRCAHHAGDLRLNFWSWLEAVALVPA